MANQTNHGSELRSATMLICLALVFFALLFLTVLLSGSPIPDLGSTPPSLGYSLLVCLPLAAVICLALSKVR